jgi:hypothetical protein
LISLRSRAINIKNAPRDPSMTAAAIQRAIDSPGKRDAMIQSPVSEGTNSKVRVVSTIRALTLNAANVPRRHTTRFNPKARASSLSRNQRATTLFWATIRTSAPKPNSTRPVIMTNNSPLTPGMTSVKDFCNALCRKKSEAPTAMSSAPATHSRVKIRPTNRTLLRSMRMPPTMVMPRMLGQE